MAETLTAFEEIQMRVITATANVGADHTLVLQLPPDIPPGSLAVVVVLEDTQEQRRATAPLAFHPHQVGPVFSECTYRREDIYGDDGR
jgi:hypothetical protein